jgi:prepilin-type processing-associated H-X9-DG protein/prepilin-type N-terminal cleavage/methylation domain-containing protein
VPAQNPPATLSSRRGILPARGGFTIIELTAVVAIITVLVSLLTAALNQTKNQAMRISCLDNLKQLNLAWQMYLEDFDGALPLNQTAAGFVHHRIPQLNNSTNSWVAGNPRFDRDTSNIRRGTLFPYVKSVSSYRCAMDDSRVERHPDVARTRSYSMNAFLGGDEAMNPAMRFSELRRPSSTFVFIEEHQNSRWESSFVVVPAARPGLASPAAGNSWISTPSDRHDQGCNLTFADGHIEYWRWYAPKTQRDSMMSTSAGKHRDARDLSRLQSVVGQ